jgi:hypothetical protein
VAGRALPTSGSGHILFLKVAKVPNGTTKQLTRPPRSPEPLPAPLPSPQLGPIRAWVESCHELRPGSAGQPQLVFVQ